MAEFRNNRTPMLRPVELDGVTVAGVGIPNGLVLHWPSDVLVDGHDQLYIADSRNHHIIREISGDYQCLAGGCLSGSGSSSDQVNKPYSLRLDRIGNISVADEANDRIPKLVLLSDFGRKCISLCPALSLFRFSSVIVITNSPCSVLEPCLHRESCSVVSNPSYNYLCACPSGFSGRQCEVDERMCRPERCQNQGQIPLRGVFGSVEDGVRCKSLSGAWEWVICLSMYDRMGRSSLRDRSCEEEDATNRCLVDGLRCGCRDQ